ncbi:hypothetical protein BKA57DRAFT_466562 [Linnemannia elongata]|nr:hypothetical protein BKA57DRAFT_466562 [Linnemannia elongata]
MRRSMCWWYLLSGVHVLTPLSLSYSIQRVGKLFSLSFSTKISFSFLPSSFLFLLLFLSPRKHARTRTYTTTSTAIFAFNIFDIAIFTRSVIHTASVIVLLLLQLNYTSAHTLASCLH